MRLKLTWKVYNRDIDIMVNSEQTISETIKILSDKGFLDFMLDKDFQFVKSYRNQRNINIKLTYEDGMIYSGDILEIV